MSVKGKWTENGGPTKTKDAADRNFPRVHTRSYGNIAFRNCADAESGRWIFHAVHLSKRRMPGCKTAKPGSGDPTITTSHFTRATLAEARHESKPSIALIDGTKLCGLVRCEAGRRKWGIDPKRIGILGFSASGHLAVATATHFDQRAYEPIDEIDKISCRPDLRSRSIRAI